MKLNLLGRVRNTRLSHANSLLPLFEAVINSIHAIEEVGSAALGEIKVVIERAKTQQMKIDGTAPLEPINSFRITDNGSGFTDANYESFCTSDSQLKLTRFQRERQGICAPQLADRPRIPAPASPVFLCSQTRRSSGKSGREGSKPD